jgi:threonyl-tRNA synthetase
VNQEETTVNFAAELAQKAKAQGLRVTVDNSNESVGKNIRAAEVWQVPYTVVIGEKEVARGDLTPRIRGDLVVSDTARAYGPDEFLGTVANEAKTRVSKSSM